LGATAEKIQAAAKKQGFDNVVMVSSLQEAVQECAKRAGAGDAVLLSPACASWDMFPNYEVRGKLFKQYVNELPS
jgi:UDP-N-acetylmuramoylalanine--D-glutamate ligase